MLVKIIWTRKFKRDYERILRQGKDVDVLEEVITTLAAGKQLAENHHSHKLHGKWKEYRDCHIMSDWLLIYKISQDGLLLARMGSHSELF